MVTLPAPEVLAKHHQHSITNDQWVWAREQACACAWSGVSKRAINRTDDNHDVWFESGGWGATYDTDTRENVMESVWLLVHQNYAVLDQRSNAHAYEIHMNTYQASTQHNTAMTSNQNFLPFVLGGAKENRLRKGGGERGSIHWWVRVRKPFSAVSIEWSASTSGCVKIHWHWLWLQL